MRVALWRRTASFVTVAYASCAGLVIASLWLLWLALGFGAVAVAIGVLGITIGLSGALLVTYLFVVRNWLRREALNLLGPGLVNLLPPRLAMTALLTEAYGATPESVRPVVRGILGGQGDSSDGDRSVSNWTTIHFLLSDEVPGVYSLTSTVDYRFSTPIYDDRFVIFATCDSWLKDAIDVGADVQVFDYSFTSDSALFKETVDTTFDTAEVGGAYHDRDGNTYVVPVSKLVARRVPLSEWPSYLTFFGDGGTGPKRNPEDFRESLRIYEYALSRLAPPEAPASAFDEVTLRTSSMQSAGDPHCFWSPSWPSYVDTIEFDVRNFGRHSESPLEYRLVPFLLRADELPVEWRTVDTSIAVKVRSWLMPGHGVALIWRPCEAREDYPQQDAP